MTSQVSSKELTALSLLVASTFFMENLDSTVIAPALPQMAKSFNVHPVSLSSSLSLYMITLGVGIPISGWLADRFGAKIIFSVAIFIFTLASALCGIASKFEWFIAFRVLQGVGGAMMVPVGRLAVLRHTPKPLLIRTIATLTWPALIAPVLGPPLGGLIVKYVSWRWIFYLNVPLGLVALLLSLSLVPNSRAQKRAPFDFVGYSLIGSAIASLLWVVESLGTQHGKQTWLIGFTALGLVLLTLSIAHLKKSKHPLFRLDPLKIKTFSVVLWGGSFFRMGISAIPFLLPLMAQTHLDLDSFQAGLLLMVVFAGNILMKPLTTTIMRHFRFRNILLVNGLLNAGSIAACAFFSKDTSMSIVCVVLFFSGMTRSMQFTAYNTLAFADVGEDLMNSANTLFSSILQLSLGVGVALGAISVRFAESFPIGSFNPYAIAFLIVSMASLLGLVDILSLPALAGDILVENKKNRRA